MKTIAHTHMSWNASSKLRNKNHFVFNILRLSSSFFYVPFSFSFFLFRANAISHKTRRKKNTNNRSKRIHNDRNYLGRTYSNFHVFTFEPIPQLNDVHANMMFIQCGFVIYVYFMTRPRYLFLFLSFLRWLQSFSIFPSLALTLFLFASIGLFLSLSLNHSFFFLVFRFFFHCLFCFCTLFLLVCRQFVAEIFNHQQGIRFGDYFSHSTQRIQAESEYFCQLLNFTHAAHKSIIW